MSQAGPALLCRQALPPSGPPLLANWEKLGELPVARGRPWRADGKRQRVGGQGAQHRGAHIWLVEKAVCFSYTQRSHDKLCPEADRTKVFQRC